MENLTENDYVLIREYKKNQNEDIALYFYQKFAQDVTQIVYSKINLKFSSTPFEKGDLSHIIWKCIKETLKKFKPRKGVSFNAILVKSTYQKSIRELSKFLTNKNLVMSTATSLDQKLLNRFSYKNMTSAVINNNSSRSLALQNLIANACGFVKNYSPRTVKRVIYLKSMGYSFGEIAKRLDVSKTTIHKIVKDIKRMVDKYY